MTDGRKFCFYDSEASGRGTAAAVCDCADYTEKLLGHTALMTFPRRPHSDYTGLEKLESRFSVTLYVAAGEGTLSGLGGPKV